MLNQGLKDALLEAIGNMIERIVNVFSNTVGDLSSLTTIDKETTVAAINESYAKRWDGLSTITVNFAVDATVSLNTLVLGFISPAGLTLAAGHTFISLADGEQMKIYTIQAEGPPVVTTTLEITKTNVILISSIFSLTSPTSLSGSLIATPPAFVRVGYDTGRGIFVRSLLPANTTSAHVNNLVGGLLTTPINTIMPNLLLTTINTFGNGVAHLNRINLVTGTPAEFGIITDEVASTDILLGTLVRTPVSGIAHHWNIEVFLNGRKIYKSVRGDTPDPNDNTMASVIGWQDHSADMKDLIISLTTMFNSVE